ncbi:MAG: SLBB domain-containing protein [Lentisphaerae bacterium]|nr:SLBB domain-containing protein [Lentisphaerota bacterium]
MPARETIVLKQRVKQAAPLDLAAYKASGGLAGLRKALAMNPADVVEELKRSGLTGRGGAAFLTGTKLEFVGRQTSRPKYLICNADEGEPGTGKDRLLLEKDPWAVLEGMLIAAYAVGAEQGYIYFQGEYRTAFALWEQLADVAERNHLLGERILDSPFSFGLQIVRGRGLYICGEELALIASLEMQRPTSRPKPPYPAQNGLFGQPTSINNVETLANLPVIMAGGAQAWRQLGTPEEPGTRLFTLSGDIRRPGIYELAMGSATLRELIDDLGGGTSDKRPLKAVQPGGGSSALLGAKMLDLPLTARAIREAGSSMGTGAVIVYAASRNAREIVGGLLGFYGEESCGRCMPCRLGVLRMREIVRNLNAGQGTKDDVKRLEEIGRSCLAASTCGMGQSFPLPILSALRLFPGDFAVEARGKKARTRMAGARP